MISIGMSTSCVFPLGVEQAFRIARVAGFDGIEVMVTSDAATRSAEVLRALSERYELPVLAIHAPVLFFTPFVWSRDPKVKLERSAELAQTLGAPTVVVHPPFRWQAGYAGNFERIVRETAAHWDVEIAVENMFPWKLGGRALQAYAPSPDPLDLDADAMTLDFSHASLSGRDSLEIAMAMGDRLRHVHLCDGRASVDEGNIFDEHLLPGRGTQPVAETLSWLAERHWTGAVVAEIKPPKTADDAKRVALLEETVAFAKRYVGQEHARRAPLPKQAAVSARRLRRAQA